MARLDGSAAFRRPSASCCSSWRARTLVLRSKFSRARPLPRSNWHCAPGNFARAAALLEQRAQGGDAEAQYQLASLYRSGRGVAQDDAAAFRWMKAAAEKGHANAQFNLAKMYLAGRGVAIDVQQARAWLTKAAAQGRTEASKLLSDTMEQRPRRRAAFSRLGRHDRTSAASDNDSLRAQRTDDLAGRNGQPAILDASWRGQSQSVRQLIASAADLKVKDEDGNTALALAASGGHVPTLEILLEAGADPNSTNRAGETPLLLAAAAGHAATINLLLNRGAAVGIRSSAGETALSLAVRACSIEAARTLSQQGRANECNRCWRGDNPHAGFRRLS